MWTNVTGLPLFFKQCALRTAVAPTVRIDHVGGGGEGHPCKLRGHRQLQLQVISNNTQMATIKSPLILMTSMKKLLDGVRSLHTAPAWYNEQWFTHMRTNLLWSEQKIQRWQQKQDRKYGLDVNA